MADPAQSIDDVISMLDGIVERSEQAGSRLGYFAALYRNVTIRVKEGIDSGFFDDGPRMERLDVHFANRYLGAYEQHCRGTTPTRSWAYTFEVADQHWPIVLQHLLLGMNAHINLDLGIATARTAEGQDLRNLQGDFNKINQILGSLVGSVKADLARIWVALRLFNRYLGDVENAIINFSMTRARNEAWSVAERFSNLARAEWPEAIVALDEQVAGFARIIRHPGFTGSAVTRFVRLGEIGTVAKKIGYLR